MPHYHTVQTYNFILETNETAVHPDQLDYDRDDGVFRLYEQIFRDGGIKGQR